MIAKVCGFECLIFFMWSPIVGVPRCSIVADVWGGGVVLFFSISNLKREAGELIVAILRYILLPDSMLFALFRQKEILCSIKQKSIMRKFAH